MIQIAPSSKSKDMGAKDGGEEWQTKVNLIYLKETTDFVITSANTVSEWNQDIEMGKSGSQYMTVDVSYTNTVVGTLTDADFLTDKTADCTSTCALSDWEELQVRAGLGWENFPLEGFDDKCTVPTGVAWGPGCRMQELCGTGCAPNSCNFSWPEDDPAGMDSDKAACACKECSVSFFLQ
jgi:hypothetical protein